jgi:hypothetical protein
MIERAVMRGAPGSIISLFGYSHGTLRFFWREISAGVEPFRGYHIWLVGGEPQDIGSHAELAGAGAW